MMAMIPFQRVGAIARGVSPLRRLGGEEGATVVELALSSAILLSLVFGILGICLALYAYNYVSYVAREGTRYAMVRGSACNGALPGCPGAGTGVDVQSYINQLGFPGIIINNLTVTTTWPSSGPSCPTSGPCDSPGSLVQVQVNYQFPLQIPFLPASTLSLNSTSEMVISQ
jgi:hypothetical protein